MTRPISKKQMTDLWFEEFCSGEQGGHCCILCGQLGYLDTRGRVTNPRGQDCGGQAFCICPNGRSLKKQYEDAANLGDDA